MRRSIPLLSVVALLLAGCGLTDNGPKLDVAAEIDGQSVALSRIDDAVGDYCALISRHGDTEPPVPKADIRGQFVLVWAQAVAVTALAQQYGVAVPSGEVDRATVLANWGEDGQIDEDDYDSFAWLSGLQQKVQPVLEIGARATLDSTGQLPADEAAAQSAGLTLVQQWIEEHDLVVNPVFGDLDVKAGTFSADSLSVPASKESKPLGSEPTEADVAALPDSERCGAKPAAPATGVPAA